MTETNFLDHWEDFCTTTHHVSTDECNQVTKIIRDEIAKGYPGVTMTGTRDCCMRVASWLASPPQELWCEIIENTKGEFACGINSSSVGVECGAWMVKIKWVKNVHF